MLLRSRESTERCVSLPLFRRFPLRMSVPANALISAITDRMPLILVDEDLPVWLGEAEVSEAEIRALIRTVDFSDRWEIFVEDPSKRPPRPRKPKT